MKVDNVEKKAAKAGVWYTFANFFSKGAVYLTVPFFTRLMTKSEMGDFNNITSWLQVLLPIVTLDMHTSLKTARFDYKDEFDRYISSITFYGTLIASFFYLIVLTNVGFFSNLFSMSSTALHIVFIYMLVRPALDVFQGQNNIRYKYKSSVIISTGSTVLSLLVSLLFVNLAENKVIARTIGQYGVYVLICLGIYAYMLWKGKGISFKYFGYSVKISFPLMWHVLSMHVLASCDRIIIKRILGSAATALYSVSYTCSHVVSVLFHSMNSAWSPWAMLQMHEGKIDKLKSASRWYVLLFSCAIIVFLLICPELLWILGGNKYMEAKYVMPPAMIAVVPQFIYSLYIDAEIYLKVPKRIAIGTLIAAVLNLVLNFIFIPVFGYVAAAYTTLAGYLALFAFHYISVHKLGKGDWFNNRFNIMVIIASLAMIPVAVFLYTFNVIRYIVIAVVFVVGGILVYRFRKQLISVVSIFVKRKKKK